MCLFHSLQRSWITLLRPLSTADSTLGYARVSHSRQWSKCNILHCAVKFWLPNFTTVMIVMKFTETRGLSRISEIKFPKLSGSCSLFNYFLHPVKWTLFHWLWRRCGLETCMGNFSREYRGYGNKICDNPAGWEFIWRKSRGSGRKNREPTRGRHNTSIATLLYWLIMTSSRLRVLNFWQDIIAFCLSGLCSFADLFGTTHINCKSIFLVREWGGKWE